MKPTVGRLALVVVLVASLVAACSSGSSSPSPKESASGPTVSLPAGSIPSGSTDSAGTTVNPTNAPAGATAGGSSRVEDTAYPDLGSLDLDVDHYDLSIDYDVPGRSLRGRAVLSITSLADLDKVMLDFQGLDVDHVVVDGREASFVSTARKLEVALPAAVAKAAKFSVDVSYHGRPQPVPTVALGGVEMGWHSAATGSFVLSEPEGASTWFPVNNHPRDKATYAIAVTVAKPFVGIASGRLDRTDEANDKRTYHWLMERPMASYLATVVTGEFEQSSLGSQDGVTYTNWAPVGAGGEGAPFLGEDVIVSDLAKHLGPFPFETYGAVTYPIEFIQGSGYTKRFLSGVALEAQGRSLYAEGSASAETVVHETAHQWMGDSVSLSDWSQDIWWVEGFAEFTQSLAAKDRRQHFASEYADVKNNWIAPGRLAIDKLFSYGSYTEGSIVFYALEREVGEETFNKILQTFQAKYRYANASTADLIRLAGEVSGRDLTAFFDSWLFGSKPPPFPQ